MPGREARRGQGTCVRAASGGRDLRRGPALLLSCRATRKWRLILAVAASRRWQGAAVACRPATDPRTSSQRTESAPLVYRDASRCLQNEAAKHLESGAPNACAAASTTRTMLLLTHTRSAGLSAATVGHTRTKTVSTKTAPRSSQHITLGDDTARSGCGTTPARSKPARPLRCGITPHTQASAGARAAASSNTPGSSSNTRNTHDTQRGTHDTQRGSSPGNPAAGITPAHAST